MFLSGLKYGELTEVFLYLFQRVLTLCIEKGMVRGKRQSIDSPYIKTNASMDSLLKKEIIKGVEQYANELSEGSKYKVKASIKKAVERHDA